MLKNISRSQVAGAWVAAVIVAMAASVLAGVTLTMGAGELWLVAAVIPPAVLVLLWHGAPKVTAGQLMHSGDSQSKDVR